MSITVPTPPKIAKKPCRRTLTVSLTAEEIAKKKDQLIADLVTIEKLENELADEQKTRKAEIKSFKAAVLHNRKLVTAGTEARLVDAEEVVSLEERKVWVEFQGQRFEERAASEFELKQLEKAPLFPDHEDDGGDDDGDDSGEGDDDGDPDGAELARAGNDDEPPVRTEPLPSNVSDIEQVRREETKRGAGRKDHTAR